MDEKLSTLANKAAAIPEVPMRIPMAKGFLCDYPLYETVQLLDRLLAYQRQNKKLLALLDGVIAALTKNVVAYERLADLYYVAKEENMFHVCALLSINEHSKHVDESHLSALNPLSETTLGMRKFLARKPDADLIDKLINDPAPEVIKNLLNNPRLTTEQVIKLASRRPNVPKILETINNHPRWQTQYHIKKAIIYNPFTPLHVALKNLSSLLDHDLKQMITEPSVNKKIQEAAQTLWQARKKIRKQQEDKAG